MGKKRKDAPAESEAAEKKPSKDKQSRSSNFSNLSREALEEREVELAQQLKEATRALGRAKSERLVCYGDSELRAMNTKRLKIDYALAEVQAELARRGPAKPEYPTVGLPTMTTTPPGTGPAPSLSVSSWAAQHAYLGGVSGFPLAAASAGSDGGRPMLAASANNTVASMGAPAALALTAGPPAALAANWVNGPQINVPPRPPVAFPTGLASGTTMGTAAVSAAGVPAGMAAGVPAGISPAPAVGFNAFPTAGFATSPGVNMASCAPAGFATGSPMGLTMSTTADASMGFFGDSLAGLAPFLTSGLREDTVVGHPAGQVPSLPRSAPSVTDAGILAAQLREGAAGSLGTAPAPSGVPLAFARRSSR